MLLCQLTLIGERKEVSPPLRTKANADVAENFQLFGEDQGCNARPKQLHMQPRSLVMKMCPPTSVFVAIDAGGSDFQFYSSGVFIGQCGTDLDHGVTAIGYGTADDGTKYCWGENGYIRMQRDIDAEEGPCGIAMQASYPTA
ncbi:hypothetical protein ACOSQ4_011990 [Xanthoceras sorbifolium]